MKVDATEKEKTKINASELASFDDKLVEAANACIEHARTTRLIEVEVGKLKVADLLVDKKLERTRLCFEKLRIKLKSPG